MHRPRHQAGRRSTSVIAPECRGIRLPPENPRPEPLDATLFLRMLTPSTLSAIDVGAVNISARGRHSGGDSRIHPRRDPDRSVAGLAAHGARGPRAHGDVAGELPGVFALPAGVGDVLVGVLAVPVALLLQSGARSGRAAAHAWNVLGIVDLLVAIAIGALTTSGRLAVATPNTATRSYPLVMIPAFAVPLSLILHALSLRQLQGSARHRAASG